ncbi:MAG: four helix bundle protein [Chitinophagales bacterium]
MENPERNVVVQKTFLFALAIIEFTEHLEAAKKFVIANQILRSGTSIGANVREAQNASSKRDFLNRMKIALREAEETEYWLLLCKESKNYPKAPNLFEDLKTILKLINKIVQTTNASIIENS